MNTKVTEKSQGMRVVVSVSVYDGDKVVADSKLSSRDASILTQIGTLDAVTLQALQDAAQEAKR